MIVMNEESLNVLLNDVADSLEETGCDYLLALFSPDEEGETVANIGLNIEDTESALAALAKASRLEGDVGLFLLKFAARIITETPQKVWEQYRKQVNRHEIAGIVEILSEAITSNKQSGGLKL